MIRGTEVGAPVTIYGTEVGALGVIRGTRGSTRAAGVIKTLWDLQERASCINIHACTAASPPVRKEIPMTLTPRVLLDTSIAQLRTLAAFLAEEMGEYQEKSEPVASLEARACKEILLTISVLIPKLQAARYVVADEAPAFVKCVSCDEG